MALGKLSIVLLMVANACSVLSQTDPTCITPVRLEGFCVPIERCRNIYNTVRTSKTLSRNVQNYINRLECTLPDVVRSICCVPQEVDPKMPSTTPVITTTSFKTRIITTIPTTTPEITTTSTTTPASTTTPVITTTSTTTAASTTPPVITTTSATTPASTTTPAITTTSSTIPVIATIPTRTPVIMTTTTHEELNELPNGQNWSLLPTTACGQILGERIAHGNATEPFEYPWMVLLLYLWNGVLTDGCGGSLINNRYVLTAAHCVRTSSVFKLSKVRLGEHDKTKEIDCIVYEDDYKDCADRPIEIDIESTVVHSEYNRPIRFRHDIALIRMVQDVEFSDSIIPLCLPIREDIRNMMLPKYTVTGWGITEEKTASDILQQADLNHVPVSDCQQKMKENGLRIDLSEEYQMCAGGEGLVDSCKGDSGGPLGSFVDLIGGKYVQYGIVSAGAGTCGISRVPGIYTRVSSYMDWIVENMQP